jgi:hypothetical protein
MSTSLPLFAFVALVADLHPRDVSDQSALAVYTGAM